MALIPVAQRNLPDINKGPKIRDKRQGAVTPFDPSTIQNISKTIEGVGKVFDVREEKEKKYQEQKVKNQIDEVVIKANAKMVEAKGENVFRVADEQQQFINDSFDSIKGGMTARNAENLEHLFGQGKNRHKRVSLPHIVKEKSALQKTAFDTAKGIAMSETVLAAADNQQFKAGLADQVRINNNHNFIKYGEDPTPETRKLIAGENKDLVSKTILETVKQYAAEGDTGSIFRILDGKGDPSSAGYRRNLLSEDLEDVNKLIKSAQTKKDFTEGFKLMEEALRRYPKDGSQGAAFISKSARNNPNMYRAAISAYKTRVDLNNQAEKKADQDVLNVYTQRLRDNGGIARPEDQALLRMRVNADVYAKGMKVAKDMNTGKYKTASDIKILKKMRDIWSSGDDKKIEEYRQGDFNLDRVRLTDTDQKDWTDRFKNFSQRNESSSAKLRNNSDLIADRVMKARLETIGLFEGEEDYERALRFGAQLAADIQRDEKFSNPSAFREEFAQRFAVIAQEGEEIGTFDSFLNIFRSDENDVRPKSGIASSRKEKLKIHPKFERKIRQDLIRRSQPTLNSKQFRDMIKREMKKNPNIDPSRPDGRRIREEE